MDKELKESLRYMQQNPTTGLPHNQQVISTQVENIFMLDRLINKIDDLNITIKKSNEQNAQLEKSNYKLQLVMLILTFIATSIAAYPFLNGVLTTLINVLIHTIVPIETIAILTTVLSGLSGILITFTEMKILETYRISHEFNAIKKNKIRE